MPRFLLAYIIYNRYAYAPLIIRRPTHTNSRPRAKLPTAYAPKPQKWRLSNSDSISWLSDEKVVNPPQKPVIRKAFIRGEMTPPFSTRPNSTPMMKLPTMFTIKVPHGHDEPTNSAVETLPTRPPESAAALIPKV